ncbi:hypothetical protein D3C86_1729590 [compost metagenome]
MHAAKGTQRIGLALEGAGPGGYRIDQQHQPGQLRQALAGCLGSEFQGPEEECRAARQQAPEAQGQRAGQDPFEHPRGYRQEQHAEGVAHGHHPLAGPGQQCAAAGGEEHQGRAHAQAQGEELQAATQGVAACTDIEQGAGQGRGHAG